MKDYLFIIPARSGSKGVPGKNVKILGEKALIKYSIEYARHFTVDENICVTTNDTNVLDIANQMDLKIPFLRPESLSADTSSADEVIKHAVRYYEKLAKNYNAVVYLQPTSPFRKFKHLEEAIEIYEQGNTELVVSVCESHLNPYFSLFEENDDGFLYRSKQIQQGVSRRQDVPKVFHYNGSIFIINIKALLKSKLHDLIAIKKYEMKDIYSIDIDNVLDWKYAEFLLQDNLIDFD